MTTDEKPKSRLTDKEQDTCPLCGGSLKHLKDIQLIDDYFIVVRDGKAIQLQRIEYYIVRLLYKNLRRPVEEGRIFDYVYDECLNGSLKAPDDETIIRVQVSKARKKLAPLGFEIKPVYGRQSYVLNG